MRKMMVIAAVASAVALGGYALAHEPGQRHVPDPNSPSDLMMEQCTAAGLGPEGHTLVGRVIDQVHSEGAHHRMHEVMDRLMSGGRIGPGVMGPGMMRRMIGRGI